MVRGRVRECLRSMGLGLVVVGLSLVVFFGCEDKEKDKAGGTEETIRDKLESSDPAKRSEGLKEAREKYGK